MKDVRKDSKSFGFSVMKYLFDKRQIQTILPTFLKTSPIFYLTTGLMSLFNTLQK